jgi:hypothetical protein
MPEKHANTERIGGPGASHENRKQPEKSQEHVEHPSDSKKRPAFQGVGRRRRKGFASLA